MFGIESILHEETVNGQRYVLVRWSGYGPSQDTWEPLTNLPCAFVHHYEAQRSEPKNSTQHWGKQGRPGPLHTKPTSYLPTPEHIELDAYLLPGLVCMGCIDRDTSLVFTNNIELHQHEESCEAFKDFKKRFNDLFSNPAESTRASTPSAAVSDLDLPSLFDDSLLVNPTVETTTTTTATNPATETTSATPANDCRSHPSKTRCRARARKSRNFYKE